MLTLSNPVVIAILGVGSFVLFWVGINFMIARFGGWHKLASVFAFRQGDIPLGMESHLTTRFSINLSRYNGIIRMYFSGDGLYLRPVFIFRMFHPTIFIPWSELDEKEMYKEEIPKSGNDIAEKLIGSMQRLLGHSRFTLRSLPAVEIKVDKATQAILAEKLKQYKR